MDNTSSARSRTPQITIRQETPADRPAIHDLVERAFATAKHADGNEQDLVDTLRQGDAYIPELSLVAELDGKLAGHIMFTTGHAGSSEVLVLAPLSVDPAHQGKGIGSMLVEAGHRIAQSSGYEYSMVLGEADYYARFGYACADEWGVNVPEGIEREYFLAAKLSESAKPLTGDLIYAPEFGL